MSSETVNTENINVNVGKKYILSLENDKNPFEGILVGKKTIEKYRRKYFFGKKHMCIKKEFFKFQIQNGKFFTFCVTTTNSKTINYKFDNEGVELDKKWFLEDNSEGEGRLEKILFCDCVGKEIVPIKPNL